MQICGTIKQHRASFVEVALILISRQSEDGKLMNLFNVELSIESFSLIVAIVLAIVALLQYHFQKTKEEQARKINLHFSRFHTKRIFKESIVQIAKNGGLPRLELVIINASHHSIYDLEVKLNYRSNNVSNNDLNYEDKGICDLIIHVVPPGKWTLEENIDDIYNNSDLTIGLVDLEAKLKNQDEQLYEIPSNVYGGLFMKSFIFTDVTNRRWRKKYKNTPKNEKCPNITKLGSFSEPKLKKVSFLSIVFGKVIENR
jgi:hypothetical protein